MTRRLAILDVVVGHLTHDFFQIAKFNTAADFKHGFAC